MSFHPRPLSIPSIFPNNKDLVLWLPFDERSGTKAYDRSGKAHNGTLDLPTWVTMRRGSALDFDGLDDQVIVPAVGDLSSANFITKWTVAAWFKLDTVTGTQGIIEKHKPFILRTQNNKLYSYVFTTSWKSVYGATTLAIATWYHGAITWDSITQTLTLYLNGSYENSGSSLGTVTYPVGFEIIGIGGVGYDVAELLNGVIVDVRIYNRALNAAEIKRLYESEIMLVQ
jgi:hypothetical protein